MNAVTTVSHSLTPTSKEAELVNCLQRAIPSRLPKAEQKVAQLREARQDTADKLHALTQQLNQDRPGRVANTAEEEMLKAELGNAGYELNEARRELQEAREIAAPILRAATLQHLRHLSPELVQLAEKFEEAIGILSVADNFANKRGLQSLGLASIGNDLSMLRRFAALMANA